MTTRELQGRTALVTGGAKGIGRSCCELLAAAGANVAVNYLTSEQAARETAEAVEAAGVKALLCQGDLADQDQVASIIEQIERQLGPIDLLVNNAGVFDYVSHEKTTPQLWQRTLDVNLTAVYYVTWAVKTGMIERGFGRIVNVSSIAGLRPRPMSIAYAASKAGLIGLTKSLAHALAEHDIRVNAVAPGLIATEIIDGVAQEQLDALINATPIPRIGQPSEIAELVLFLLSERSSFMTGQTLVASGGRVTLP